MGTAPAALAAMTVLGGAGALPTLALVGARWASVPAAPLAGAVLAALSAAGCVALGGTVVAWFVVLSTLASMLALAVWWRRPSSRPFAGAGGTRVTPVARAAGGAGLLVVAATVAWSLVALRAPWIGFDARAIWLLHADWVAAGHSVALAALRNPALSFSHVGYPPLITGSVAVSWLVTGDSGYRLGEVVVALLNGCAVATAAMVAVEVGIRAGVGAPAVRGEHPFARPGHARALVPAIAGAVVAGLLVLTAFGVGGPFATNGYADLLWSSAAVGAIGFGLVLPGRGHDLGLSALLLAVAGLTKDEGIPIGMAIVVLMTVRAAWPMWRRRRRIVPWRPLAAGAMGVLALGAWPALVRLLGPAGTYPSSAPGQGDLLRAHLTYDAMAGYLHVVLLALPVAVVGGAMLWRARAAAGIGNDGWAWAALIAGTAIVAATYVNGKTNIQLWLVTSVHRTTFFSALAAWWIVGTWAVVGIAQVTQPVQPPPARGLDEVPAPVLHH